MADNIKGYSYNDAQNRLGIKEVYDTYQYLIDPHGALGYLAFKEYCQNKPGSIGIILETAHPSKFIEEVENITQTPVDIPERLATLAHKEKVATPMGIEFSPFKNWLLNRYA